MLSSEVVITGFGAVTPVGNDRESSWRALLAGTSGVAPITAFDSSGLRVHIAAEVKGFDPSSVLAGKRLRRSARFTQLAVAAAREAAIDSGLLPAEADGPRDERDHVELADGIDPTRVGVVINAAVAGFDTVEHATRQLLGAAPGRISPYFVSSSLTNMPACEVAIDLGLHGPVTASALACASGVYAFLEARRLILAGEADVVVCGGTDAAITPAMFGGLQAMGALSNYAGDPAEASRPFDADRDGFVFGEGSVVAVLESAEHAARRGAHSYATVAGGALTADAFHVSAPEPAGAYAANSIVAALRNAGVKPDEVDYVAAHGTSTKANDRTETLALHAGYGEAAERLAVSAPKSMVGHLIGAAGALGAMVSVLAIRDQIVPPTINLHTPDPDCDLDYVPNVARRMPVAVSATNAFGFGGQNCVAIFNAPQA
ncbi:beta-ketoacyl-[acyl-carrier-protein] synthase family protein [Microlunatus soli]|uniref:3-oxoacyl-[acyl-carrier-protein] synthase II n=1 Tax=Microlunatus soli TaxID=630515 RepID=A0A1H1RV01_9ACTN|nr:beta-ketoacyl-ACP synthase II [Microlunatus soli]SDS39597.1 3-oxoacyl-[acyl-carrier-protein] synthase II [Microlunatus soli]